MRKLLAKVHAASMRVIPLALRANHKAVGSTGVSRAFFYDHHVIGIGIVARKAFVAVFVHIRVIAYAQTDVAAQA